MSVKLIESSSSSSTTTTSNAERTRSIIDKASVTGAAAPLDAAKNDDIHCGWSAWLLCSQALKLQAPVLQRCRNDDDDNEEEREVEGRGRTAVIWSTTGLRLLFDASACEMSAKMHQPSIPASMCSKFMCKIPVALLLPPLLLQIIADAASKLTRPLSRWARSPVSQEAGSEEDDL